MVFFRSKAGAIFLGLLIAGVGVTTVGAFNDTASCACARGVQCVCGLGIPLVLTPIGLAILGAAGAVRLLGRSAKARHISAEVPGLEASLE